MPRTILTTLSACLLIGVFCTAALAQNPDHLTCYKIKDTAAKNEVTLHMAPADDDLPVSAGCTLETRSKELCTPSVKTLVQPPAPPRNVDGQALENAFLCYKIKCPKLEAAEMFVQDQFAQRHVSGFKVKRVCVPAESLVPDTTTTTLQVTTTTVQVTTTLALPECGNGVVELGENCDDSDIADGDGCSGVCQQEAGFECTGQPSVCATTCGDGIPAGVEQCDDAPPAENGDGCSAQCQVEGGFDCAGVPSVCVPS